MTLKNRLISGFLTFVMALSFVPTMSFVTDTEVQAETKSETPNVMVYEAGSLESKGLTKIVDGATTSFYKSLWHFSGGYWAPKETAPKSQRVYDSEFRKSQGGTADIEGAFGKAGILAGVNDFEYLIDSNSELAKSLDAGDDLYLEISPASSNPEVTLDKLFNFPITQDSVTDKTTFEKNADGSLMGYDSEGNKTTAIAKVEKVNGQWKIIFSLPIKLNTYSEKIFNFNKFNLGLTKYIPIPKLGFGYIMFSMFPRNGGSKYFSNSSSWLWFGDENDTASYNQWQTSPQSKPQGKLAPTEIIKGSNGLLEDGIPIYLYNEVDKELDSKYMKIGINTLNDAGAVGAFYNYGLKLNIYAKPKIKVIASYVERNDRISWRRIRSCCWGWRA